jgi:hypothetical protein
VSPISEFGFNRTASSAKNAAVSLGEMIHFRVEAAPDARPSSGTPRIVSATLASQPGAETVLEARIWRFMA